MIRKVKSNFKKVPVFSAEKVPFDIIRRDFSHLNVLDVVGGLFFVWKGRHYALSDFKPVPYRSGISTHWEFISTDKITDQQIVIRRGTHFVNSNPIYDVSVGEVV